MNKKQIVLIAAIIAFIAGLVIISLIMNNGKTKDNGYNNIQIIGEDQFEELVLNADKPVLVDFYADWCGPCKILSPTLEEIANEKKYSDRFYFYKVNVDTAFNIAEQYNIHSIPTIIIFKDGSEFIRNGGVVDKDYIINMLKQGLE